MNIAYVDNKYKKVHSKSQIEYFKRLARVRALLLFRDASVGVTTLVGFIYWKQLASCFTGFKNLLIFKILYFLKFVNLSFCYPPSPTRLGGELLLLFSLYSSQGRPQGFRRLKVCMDSINSC